MALSQPLTNPSGPTGPWASVALDLVALVTIVVNFDSFRFLF